MNNESSKDPKKILIAIPTRQRLDGLKSALDSLEEIGVPDDVKVELLVVENDNQKNYQGVINNFKRFPVRYELEKQTGLVHVRNRILKEAQRLNADYLAGFDDDEVVDINWLENLWNGLQKYQADVVTGPTFAKFSGEVPDWIIEGDFFKTESSRDTGTFINRAAGGNYLMDLAFINDKNIRFDLNLNNIGSEDTDFFGRISQQGGKIVWLAEAVTFETVPKERLNFKYLAKRDYRIGIGRARRAKKKSWFNGLMSGILSLINILVYLIILLFTWNKAGFNKRLCKIVKQFGILSGLFRRNYKAYGNG